MNVDLMISIDIDVELTLAADKPQGRTS